jgi:hypothetical protein
MRSKKRRPRVHTMIEVFFVHGEKEIGGGPDTGEEALDFRDEREVCVLELGRLESSGETGRGGSRP